MHRGHDHDHMTGTAPSYFLARHGAPLAPGSASNGATGRPIQWQAVHLADGQDAAPIGVVETDCDLVEAAFIDAFADAPDPTSFLRLAGVPFEAAGLDGKRLALLRVEIDWVADVGAVMPQLGGGAFTYNPLPAKLTARRRRLRFVYFDGTGPAALGLTEARALASRG